MTTGSIAIAGTASAAGAPNTSNTLTINSTIACYVYHNYPGAGITFAGSGANRKMYMKIISDALTSTTIHIKNIEIRNWNYQSNAQQYISAVYLEPVGGALTNKIWTGANTQRIDPLTLPYPSSASFTGNVSIAPGQTRELVFTFNKNYAETGNEYIWVTFAEAGCPVLKSEDPSQVKP